MSWSSILAFLLFSTLWLQSFAQSTFEDDFNRQYGENIKKEYINDVYIPVDVHDAMNEIDRLSDEVGRQKMMETSEEIVKQRLVFGLGKWMISNWNFYGGSRLSHTLKEKGVAHPDDMAEYLIVTYYRKLKSQPLDLDERAREIFEKRKKEQEKRNLEKSRLN